MNTTRVVIRAIACGSSLLVATFGLAGCTGDDITYGPADAAPRSDAAVVDATTDDAGDASLDAAPLPTRVLLTYVGAAGEMVALDESSGQKLGAITTPGDVITSGGFLVQTSKDLVQKLAPASPWLRVGSWNVALDDKPDGSTQSADPVQVIGVSATKAYVLRLNRNRIAVIDPSEAADGGVPKESIDLGALQQADDKDGHVDMSGAVYDASRKRLYVALSNVDFNRVDPQGFFLICPATKSTLLAIDTTSDTLVNLGGAGPQGSIALKGTSMQLGYYGGIVLDTVKDRVLLMTTGCNDVDADGGQLPLRGRGIEAVDLKTNVTQVLLDANAQDFPGAFAYQDATHAFVQFGYGAFGKTYRWDTNSPTLGAALDVTPDLFVLDPKTAQLLGPQSTFASDGGPGPTLVISVNPVDGGVTKLATDPFTEKGGGYLGNVSLY
ncbi:MAG TPA: hypothetical protein VF316_05980 [Polyangiaceae bacterium]